MIEINLSTTQKAIDLQNVGGVDLSKINVKMVLLALVILYLPDFYLASMFEEENAAAQARFESLTKERDKLKRQVEGLQEYDKQIQALRRQEQKLKDKLDVVRSILSKRQNPWPILAYVARNIPPEVWLREITFANSKLVFRGMSLDYTPQGVFLENLKKSVFFEKNITYTKSDASSLPEDEKNLAPFEITATVSRFE